MPGSWPSPSRAVAGWVLATVVVAGIASVCGGSQPAYARPNAAVSVPKDSVHDALYAATWNASYGTGQENLSFTRFQISDGLYDLFPDIDFTVAKKQVDRLVGDIRQGLCDSTGCYPSRLMNTKEGRAVVNTTIDVLLGLADDATKKKPAWNALVKGLRAGAKIGGTANEWFAASRPASEANPRFDADWERRKVAEYVDHASDNRLLGHAVDAQFAKPLGVRISQTTKQIIAANPELGKLLREAGVSIATDGTAYVTASEAGSQAADELDEMRDVLDDVSKKLDEVLAAQETLAQGENPTVTWDGSPDQAKTKEELRDDFTAWRHELAGAGAAVSLLSSLISFADPRAGNAFAVIGSAYVQIGNAVVNYLENVVAFPNLAASSSLVMAGDIAGAVTSVAKLLIPASSRRQPTTKS